MERNPRQCKSCRDLALDGCRYEDDKKRLFERYGVRPDLTKKLSTKSPSDAEAKLAQKKAEAISKGCPNVRDGIQALSPIAPIGKVRI